MTPKQKCTMVFVALSITNSHTPDQAIIRAIYYPFQNIFKIVFKLESAIVAAFIIFCILRA